MNTRATRTSAKRTFHFWRTMRCRRCEATIHSPVDEGSTRWIRRRQSGWLDRATGRRSGATSRNSPGVVERPGLGKVSEEDIFSKYTSDADGQTAPPYVEAFELPRTRKICLARISWAGDTDAGQDLAKLSIPGLGYSATAPTTRASGSRGPVDRDRLQGLREKPAIVTTTPCSPWSRA